MKQTTKFHYVYRITSIIENKHYYGSRSSILPPKEDLGFKYFTSSRDKEFVSDLKLNTNNYKLKIVSVFLNRNAAMLLEIKLHNKFDVGKNPNFYNKCKATSTGFSMEGIKQSETTKIKRSESLIGRKSSPETKAKLSKLKIGDLNPAKREDIRLKISKSKLGNTNMLGKTHSIETKEKISKSNKGKISWNRGTVNEISEETRQKMSDAKLNMTDEQKKNMHLWKKGRKLSENVKEKLRKPQKKIQCPICEKIGGISAMKQSHFNNCKWRVDNPEK